MSPRLACLLAALALLAVSAHAGAPSPIPPASQCKNFNPANPLMGGWQPVDSEAAIQPEIVYPLILARLRREHPTWLPCAEPLEWLNAACSQVVAGQNVQVIVTLGCKRANGSNAVARVMGSAFLPLPSSNEAPRLTSYFAAKLS